MKKKKEKENISETEDIEATSINGEDSVDEQTSENSIKDSETSDSEQNKEKQTIKKKNQKTIKIYGKINIYDYMQNLRIIKNELLKKKPN